MGFLKVQREPLRLAETCNKVLLIPRSQVRSLYGPPAVYRITKRFKRSKRALQANVMVATIPPIFPQFVSREGFKVWQIAGDREP